jgi:hypothetical protein
MHCLRLNFRETSWNWETISNHFCGRRRLFTFADVELDGAIIYYTLEKCAVYFNTCEYRVLDNKIID